MYYWNCWTSHIIRACPASFVKTHVASNFLVLLEQLLTSPEKQLAHAIGSAIVLYWSYFSLVLVCKTWQLYLGKRLRVLPNLQSVWALALLNVGNTLVSTLGLCGACQLHVSASDWEQLSEGWAEINPGAPEAFLRESRLSWICPMLPSPSVFPEGIIGWISERPGWEKKQVIL